MVEASQIDFACHANNDTYLLAELRDMDEAVASAYAYAKGRDDTLVLITGDHEAGMLALRESPDRKVIVEFTTKSHGFSMVPVLAFGPCAEQFAGVYENTSIFDRVSALLGF
jgi:alkaline phosphatase